MELLTITAYHDREGRFRAGAAVRGYARVPKGAREANVRGSRLLIVLGVLIACSAPAAASPVSADRGDEFVKRQGGLLSA